MAARERDNSEHVTETARDASIALPSLIRHRRDSYEDVFYPLLFEDRPIKESSAFYYSILTALPRARPRHRFLSLL